MLKIKSNRKAAFTLAETLITVVILGILAAILVPNLIKNQVENANRTKVKKAMAAYEKAINMMIIENDIKSTEALRELGQDNCQYTREYFKTVQDGSNNCIFKTADRVWWDITDITNPILILKEEQTQKETDELRALAQNVNDYTTFAMVGRFDDLGTLRVNDNAYEQGLDNNFTNQKYVGKLWYFITQSPSVLTEIQKCQAEYANTCTISKNGVVITYTRVSIPKQSVNENHYHNQLCLYSRETNSTKCGYVSKVYEGDYYIYNFGQLTQEEAKNAYNESSVCGARCSEKGDYYEAAKKKCELQGARLPKIAELKYLADQHKLANGYYWAEEECGSYSAYDVAGNGYINTRNSKSDDIKMVICVGNG